MPIAGQAHLGERGGLFLWEGLVTKPLAKNTKVKKQKPTSEPKGARRQGTQKKVDPHSLMEQAYEKVAEKLGTPESSKAIDDLVKLLKAQKDLGGEEKDVKEIKVRWEQNGDESSSEE